LDSNSGPCIDLHTHSTASDGTHTPSELISLAHQSGLGAISITDHDTIDGARRVASAPTPEGLRFLPGVEISATPPPFYRVSGSIHILGYGIDLDNRQLLDTLEQLQQSRKNRNPKIIERLNALGVQLALADVIREAGKTDQLGRPHIANAMVRLGVVPDFDTAFDQYLGTGRPAYVNKYRVPAEDAIAIILAAGGIPILAHPGLYHDAAGPLTDAHMDAYRKMGLMGIEVYYPEHSSEVVTYYRQLAKRHDLLITGGTDFHGDIRPGIELGRGSGDLYVPMALYDALIARLPRHNAI
jgi:predicted metal-dependent phosphoesterase TrpH